MDPDKEIRIQACFYRGHRRANCVTFRSTKNVDVVPCCADVVNIARPQKKVLPFAADDERRGVRRHGNGRSAGGSFIICPPQRSARTVESFVETLIAEWL